MRIWRWAFVLVVIAMGFAPIIQAKASRARGANHLSSTRARSPKGPIDTFREAKKVAHRIHDEYPETIYCGCDYKENRIDLASCGYKIHKDAKRAGRLEWEHVVPAEAFGQSFKEWREGDARCVRKGRAYHGRKCAEKNHDFNLMESDLYNLWPEVGELNGLRSNFSMAEISGPALSFGKCSAKIQDRKFEPMDAAKGIVARVYLYMEQAYPGHGVISDKNRKLFEAWDQTHPVTPRECKVGRKVFELQHRPNPVLASRCKGQAGW